MENEFSALIKDKTKAEVIQNDCFVFPITQEQKKNKLNHQAVGI